MKSLLLSASQDAGTESRLQCALDIARRCDAHLILLQVQPAQDYMAMDIFGGAYVMADVLAKATMANAENRQVMGERLANEAVQWDWQDGTGYAADLLVESARFADLIVVSLGEGNDQAPYGASVGAIVLDSGRPVLAVPHVCGRMGFDRAMIAYDGSGEAANAIRGALPLLRLAETLVIVEVEEKSSAFPMTDAAAYLARHGVSCEIQSLPRTSEGIAETVLHFASEFAPDYIVMGAYGHSRWRQRLFGGVTRHMLAEANVPLLLAS